jgi:hypothetical protein
MHEYNQGLTYCNLYSIQHVHVTSSKPHQGVSNVSMILIQDEWMVINTFMLVLVLYGCCSFAFAFFYQHCYLACMSTGVIDQLRLYDRAHANMIMLNRQIVLSHLNDLKSFIGKLNINIFLLF